MPLYKQSTIHYPFSSLWTFQLVSSFHIHKTFCMVCRQKWTCKVLGYKYVRLDSILPNVAKNYQKFSKVVVSIVHCIKIFSPDENILQACLRGNSGSVPYHKHYNKARHTLFWFCRTYKSNVYPTLQSLQQSLQYVIALCLKRKTMIHTLTQKYC